MIARGGEGETAPVVYLRLTLDQFAIVSIHHRPFMEFRYKVSAATFVSLHRLSTARMLPSWSSQQAGTCAPRFDVVRIGSTAADSYDN